MRTGETGALGYRSPLWKQGAPGQGQTLLPLAVRVDAVPNVVHDHKLSVAVNALDGLVVTGVHRVQALAVRQLDGLAGNGMCRQTSDASPHPAELCCGDGTEVFLDRRLEGNSVASHLA